MSSNPFGNLSTQNTEAVEDRLGGGNFEAISTDIYTGKIKVAYAGESSGGARSLTIIATGGDFGEREYRETIYLTSGRDKGQKNTYDKDGKTYQLPGFIIANHLAQCTVGKQIMELQFEDKMVNIYDPDLKKEAPKSVPVAIELIGQEVSFAIVREVRTAQEKNQSTGQYQDKADGSTRTSNVIEKVFNSAYKMTVHEAEAKQKDANFVADFWDKWIERNKDKDRDRTSKGGNAGQAGRPGQSAGGAPTSSQGGGDAPRKSLFGGN